MPHDLFNQPDQSENDPKKDKEEVKPEPVEQAKDDAALSPPELTPKQQPTIPEKNYNQEFAELLNRLNDEQREAVQRLDGPVLVIAGPGTGKTETLAARIGYILSSPELQANPYNILCLTFTESGAVAMRKRLLEFIGPDAHRIRIHTFHSFCNDIIQSWPEQFSNQELMLVSELEQIDVLKEILDQMPADSVLKHYKGNIYKDTKPLLNLFSLMKSEGWDTDYINKAADAYIDSLADREEFVYKRTTKDYKAGDLKMREVAKEEKKMARLKAGAELFGTYRETMKEKGRYDFDDMILWVLEAFRDDEEFLLRFQEQINYVLVDEYQDTNGSQNELLKLLINYWESPDVFVVGDDDQSIFRFQGANVRNIEEFFSKYKDVAGKPVVLKENYRSTQHVLDASKALIDHNQERLTKILDLDKNLVARHPDFADSNVLPEVIGYANPVHEEAAIVEQIEALAKKGEQLSDVAIIYRKHAQVDHLIKVLEQKKIPYNLVKQVNILSVPVINSLLKILDFVFRESKDPLKQEDALFELMHVDVFGIHADDIAAITLHNAAKKWSERSIRRILLNRLELESLGLKNAAAPALFMEKINRWIKGIHNENLQVFIEQIMEDCGLLDQVLNAPDRIWQLESVNAFFNYVKREHGKAPDMTVGSLLATIDLMRDNRLEIQAARIMRHEGGVNLMTAHGSKGLQFKHVFLIGCTSRTWERSMGQGRNYFSYPDTLTPSNEGDETEESRRLFYVALTRAQETLQISYPMQVNGEEHIRSRFIDEMLSATELPTSEPPMDQDHVVNYLGDLYKQEKTIAAVPPESTYVDQALEKFVMNTTSLNKYLDCPVAFYYERILKVPVAKNEYISFGTATHDMLRDFFVKMKETEQFPTKEEMVKLFFHHLTRQKDGFTDQKYKLFGEYGSKAVGDYYDRWVGEWNRIVRVEHDISKVEMNGVPLNGRLDKLEFDGKTVNVVDYKTGNAEYGQRKMNGPTERNPKGGDYWRQLVFYKILMDQDRRNDWNMISGEMDFIEPHEEKGFLKLKLVITPEHLQVVKRQITESYEKIMAKQFSPGCGKPECKWCHFEAERHIPTS